MLNKIYATPTQYEPRFGVNATIWDEQFVKANIRDRELVDYVLDGIKNGFNTGICDNAEPISAKCNHKIDIDSKIQVCNDIIKGLDKGYLLGPFSPTDPYISNVTISKIGSVIKPEKIRIIHNYKHGYKQNISLNDFVDPEFKTVKYSSTRDRVEFIDHLGRKSWIWVVDMQDAYKAVPIRASQRKFFGFEYCGMVFVFASLSFGLASACQIYSKFAEAVRQLAVEQNPEIFKDGLRHLLMNYLDDFWDGSSDYETAKLQFDTFIKLLEVLGIPTRDKKCHPPAQLQKILGFMHDTVRWIMYVPIDKARSISLQALSLSEQKKVTRRELAKINGM